MEPALSSLAAGLCILAIVGVVAILGFRDGDRDEDARVDVHIVASPAPDGRVLEAVIVVRNPAPAAVLGSARITRATPLARLVSFPSAVRTVTLHRRSLGERAVLGAVPAHSSRTWRVPVGDDHALHRVQVWLDQPGGRSRITSALCDAPREAMVSHIAAPAVLRERPDTRA
jgi:hypothetical protein